MSDPPVTYQEDQRSFFDKLITGSWDSYHSPLWNEARRLEVAELFARLSPRTILDVGCGCGFHDVLMAEQEGVAHVEGIDYSARSIQVAQLEYPHPRVHRRVGDLFAEAPAQYDLVVSFQVIEHVRDQLGFLRACARQVRNGGWVAVATPNRLRLDNRIRLAFRREPVLIDPMHFRELSIAELRELGRAAGLESVASFAHGLSLTVPRVNRQIVPPRRRLGLGRHVPRIANQMCAVFRAPR
jgi:SAM-dependent methyltransferase